MNVSGRQIISIQKAPAPPTPKPLQVETCLNSIGSLCSVVPNGLFSFRSCRVSGSMLIFQYVIEFPLLSHSGSSSPAATTPVDTPTTAPPIAAHSPWPLPIRMLPLCIGMALVAYLTSGSHVNHLSFLDTHSTLWLAFIVGTVLLRGVGLLFAHSCVVVQVFSQQFCN